METRALELLELWINGSRSAVMNEIAENTAEHAAYYAITIHAALSPTEQAVFAALVQDRAA